MSRSLDPYGDEELTGRLLEAGGDPNWTMGAWGFGGTCLHEAVVLDAGPPVIRALLDHGAEVGAHDRDRRTPLALSVCLNRDGAAALLRQRGARQADHLWVCRAERAADTQAVALLLAGGAGHCSPQAPIHER